MKKALVIGLGKSGLSALNFLKAKGFDAYGYDDQKKRIDFSLDFFDLIVVSPGVPQEHPLYRLAVSQGKEVIGEAELGFRYVAKSQKVIGITGTNGKTTVTSMVEHVLNFCKIDAVAVGNIGVPITEEVLKGHQKILVAELSSYQLETMSSKILDAAVLLNISDDHLDRYPSFDAYKKAKFQIKNCLKENAPFFSFVDQVNDDFEKGNRKSAFLLCQTLGITKTQFDEAIASFCKPPHRLEFVCNMQGVDYYNDSKGTNVDAVLKAVKKVKGPVILIAGGQAKGASFYPWKMQLRDKIKQLIAIGEAKDQMKAELFPEIDVHLANHLKEAVVKAHHNASKGDTVLLSPGCASFDQFDNYADRGNLFKEYVYQLNQEDEGP